jgi:hypothetical protein
MPLNRVVKVKLTNLFTSQTLEVSDLRVTFDIKKKRKADENHARISIYNLSSHTRFLMQAPATAAGDGQTQISLLVGYEDTEVSELFRGVGNLVSEYKAPDWVTSIDATDGVDKLGAVIFEKQYSAKYPVAGIVDDIIKASGMPAGNTAAIPGRLKKARSFSGPVSKILADLQSTYNFTFDVQNETANTSLNIGIDPRQIVSLGIENGLIGYPKKKGKLVVVECLINSAIRTNGFVQLNTTVQGLTAVYSVKKIDVKGDNWSGQWTMVLELQNPTVPLTTDFGVGGILA